MSRIEQFFDLPPVDGWEYIDDGSYESEATLDVEDDSEVVADVEFEGTDVEDAGDADALFPPDTMEIVEARTRLDANGRTVVDIVVEVDGSPGTLQYDVRLSKR